MKTFLSRYVKKSTMNENAVATLQLNMKLYNHVLHQMVSDAFKPTPDKYKDLSFHMRYVREYGLSHYMTTNLTAAAGGIIDAAKDALALDIKEKESRLKQMNQKLAALQKKYDTMSAMKMNLKERSQAKQQGIELPPFKSRWGRLIRVQQQKDERLIITVDTGGRKTSKKRKPKGPLIFDNEYLFEHNYVDPYLRRLRARMGQIRSRKHNLETKLAALKKRQETGHPSICFGGKKLARQRSNLRDMTAPKPCAKDRRKHVDKKARAKSTQRSLDRRQIIKDCRSQKKKATPGMLKEWRRRHEQSLVHEMVLVGRRDLKNGNAMVKYNLETRELTYTISPDSVVVFPRVVFPYGQELIDQAVAAHDIEIKNRKLPDDKKIKGWKPIPVTWAIRDCGSAFLIKCTIEVPENPHMNTDYSDGCIGFDMNYDHLAVSETDAKGDLVQVRKIPFNMTTHSGGQNTNEISNAIEKVFKMAAAAKKPVVMEDITKIEQEPMYGNKKKNRKVSQFAYAKMTDLAKNKSQKYGIGLLEVNPAFTSQIGKIKYMRRFGLSIHGAACYTIARRGAGLDEPVPDEMKHLVPRQKQNANEWTQWSCISNALKRVPIHKFYRGINYNGLKTLKELKIALTQ